MMEGIAIGIDLGTTFSCVGVFQHGRAEIIANDQGNRTTPSYVAFSDSERLVGESALSQVSFNPVNTIFDAKRLIGRKFDDPKTQEDMRHWPFKVIEDAGKPKLSVVFKGEVKIFNPEEISAMILSKMKETAEAYLGCKVQKAVITVPAYFNDSQRQATKDAGKIAGLDVLRIVNEPTAAALAFGLDKNHKEEKNVLVFDLGGGTFDVSILTISQGELFEVLATAGDTHLGGEDFDNQLVDYCVQDFIRKNGYADIKSNPRSMRRLKTECERIKRTLSSSSEAIINVESLFNGVDYFSKITRAKFESLCDDLFRSTLKPLEKALNEARIDKSDIHEIVLVGGSTRIPKVQKLLKDFFNGKEPNMSVNPDEAVACGAAIQAAVLTENMDVTNILLVDVTPLSMGIEIQGGIMSKIIKNNSRIPVKTSQFFTTAHDDQSSVKIEIYEGERSMTVDNNKLGCFTLSNIPPKPRGEPKVEVTFDLDSNGILQVSAESHGKKESLHIDKKRLSDEEICRILENAKMFEMEDHMRKENAEARNNFEIFIHSTEKSTDSDEVKARCVDACEWLESNPDATKADVKEAIKLLRGKQFCS